MAREQTRKMVTLAVLAAIALVVTLVARISFVPAASYLKYDPKDVILLTSGFLYGPWAAFAISVVVASVEMVTVSESGIIGLVMSVVASFSFVCPAVLLYRKKNTTTRLFAGLALGTLCMTGMMLLWNYFLTPIYTGMPREAVAAMLLPVFLPFNLIKGALNAALALLLYKPLFAALSRSGYLPKDALPASGKITLEKRKRSVAPSIVAVVVLLCSVSGILIWQTVA